MVSVRCISHGQMWSCQGMQSFLPLLVLRTPCTQPEDIPSLAPHTPPCGWREGSDVARPSFPAVAFSLAAYLPGVVDSYAPTSPHSVEGLLRLPHDGSTPTRQTSPHTYWISQATPFPSLRRVWLARLHVSGIVTGMSHTSTSCSVPRNEFSVCNLELLQML